MTTHTDPLRQSGEPTSSVPRRARASIVSGITSPWLHNTLSGERHEEVEDCLERRALGELLDGLDLEAQAFGERFHGLDASHVRARQHPERRRWFESTPARSSAWRRPLRVSDRVGRPRRNPCGCPLWRGARGRATSCLARRRLLTTGEPADQHDKGGGRGDRDHRRHDADGEIVGVELGDVVDLGTPERSELESREHHSGHAVHRPPDVHDGRHRVRRFTPRAWRDGGIRALPQLVEHEPGDDEQDRRQEPAGDGPPRLPRRPGATQQLQVLGQPEHPDHGEHDDRDLEEPAERTGQGDLGEGVLGIGLEISPFT